MNSKTKVLVVTDFSDKPERHLFMGLAAAGFQIEVLCHPESQEASEFVPAGIPTTPLNVRHRLDLKAISTIRRMLQEKKYDIIYACRNSRLSVSLLARRGLPAKVIGYRGTTGHLNWFDPGSLLTYLNPRVDHIVCVSDAVRKYLRGMHLPDKRLSTIYKGHDVSWYRKPDRAILASLGIPQNVFTIGFAANMRPVKGGHILIEAFTKLVDKIPAHLLMVGEVRDSRITKLAAGSEAAQRIHLPGFRNDAASLMGACDLFVMPSLEREGLPRAIIEAMSQSVPIVASSVGGIPELVDDGKTGILVPPNNSDLLAAAIQKMHDEQAFRADAGRLARQRIVENFNIATTISKYAVLFSNP